MGKLLYGTAYDGKVRFSAIDSKDLVMEARERHKLSYLPSVVLGRLITGAALTVPWLGEGETITFIISGDGPAGNVTAQASSEGTVRGYISNTSFELKPNSFGKFDVKGAVGKGDLTVVRDIGLKTPYTSKVPLISGEIAEDIAYYYTKSEQIPSAFAIGVLMDQHGIEEAGGVAVQILDRTISSEVLDSLERNFTHLSITTLMKEKSMEDILTYLLATNDILYETMDVVFKCNCSKEKALQSLNVLSLDDLVHLIGEGGAEVTCNWCSSKYYFSKEEVENVLHVKQSSKES
ncbi:MAG TPA: Hsp33 family molecular chaperone HslO [Fervidobacterium sp.]|nr:Hsp33 family molecular chaperone HslO [Fervidobacterium sp.]HPC24303.1 Hsp33 family molecular chaperone HslO [Fervidobacterium sp.]HPT58703.1 Hsp33 family molecular chaperone HslO [Fervidobacterium sp.]